MRDRRGRLGLSAVALESAWTVFCLALPLSLAGANMGWGLVGLALAAVARAGGTLDWDARRSELERPLLAFLAAAVAAAALGVDPARSFSVLHKDAHKVWLYLLFSVGLASLASLRGPRASERLAASLAVGFAAAAVTGIGQALLGSPPGGGWTRASAFVHPVTFGNQMALAVCGAFAFFASPPELPDGRGESPPRRLWQRRASAGALALFAAALLLSQTRGAVLGAALGLGTVCLAHPGLRRRAVWAAPIGLGAFLLADLVFTQQGRSVIGYAVDTLFGGIQRTHSTPADRLSLWKAAWGMFLDHPWTGVGANNFRELFRAYQPPVEGQADWGTCHNLVLQHLAERGLLGAAALAGVFAALWARAWRRAAAIPDAWNLWALAATVTFTAMNMTEVAFQTEQVWMLFFFIWVWAERRHLSYGRLS